MSKDQEFIKWWEANKQDIYDKVLSTSWGSVHHFTQIAFEAGKRSAQQTVEADADLLPCGHSRKYIVYGHKRVYCGVCDRSA